ncbi:MAG: thioredoxin family protein, partial [Bacteroidota bacterium]
MRSILMSAVALLMLLGFRAPTGYDVGDEVDDFRLKNVDGSFVSMASLEDAKGVIITFTCNSCPYSKLYEQRIIDLDNTFRP